MDNLINKIDFAGRWNLVINDKFQEDNFNTFIAELQDAKLNQFLGIDLYDELAADIIVGGGVPTEPKWVAFLDGTKYISPYSAVNVRVTGFKEILKRYVYAEWILQTQLLNSGSGFIEPENVNSEKASSQQLRRKANCSYNEAVKLSLSLYIYLFYSNDYKDINLNFKRDAIRGDIKTVTIS